MTSPAKHNTKCSFSCPQGYQLQGPSKKQCRANGQWTDSAKPVSCKGSFTFSVSFLTKINFICNIQIVALISGTDKCAVSNGGCSHKCVNTARGYKCECPDPELSLSSDNKTCHG